MWLATICANSGALKFPVETQSGNCWYHTQLCPEQEESADHCERKRTCRPLSIWPFCLARFAITSPAANVKTPLSGSVASCKITISKERYILRLYTTYPFHTICRSYLSKLQEIVQIRAICGVVKFRVICSRPKVKFPMRLRNRIQPKYPGSGTWVHRGARCSRRGGRKSKRQKRRRRTNNVCHLHSSVIHYLQEDQVHKNTETVPRHTFL